MTPVRVLLIGQPAARDRLRDSLRSAPFLLVGELDANMEACEAAAFLQPEWVIVAASDATGLLERVRQLAPRCRLALVGALSAVPADMPEVLVTPDEADLAAAMRQRMAPGAGGAGTASEIIVCWAPRDGVGCSSLAVNLAVLLANHEHHDVIVVDAAGAHGDLDLMLNLAHGDPADELAPPLRHASGLRLMSADHPALQDADRLSAWLRASARGNTCLVVDTHSARRELNREVLLLASRVLVPVRLELGYLRALQRELARWHGEGLDTSAFELLAWDERSEVSRDEAARMLRRRLAGTLPVDTASSRRAINLGIPMVQSDPGSAFARQLANLLTPQSPSVALVSTTSSGALKGLLSWLRRGPSTTFGG